MSANVEKKMTYVRLGNSGLKVSKIILGTMQYGSPEWQDWVIGDEEEVIKHIKFAYDAGIQTFDTADMYSNGLSEILLGKAIKKLNLSREEIVVMTKVYSTVAREHGTYMSASGIDPDELGYVNQRGLSRKHKAPRLASLRHQNKQRLIHQKSVNYQVSATAAVKHSLERLQLDYVDVLQCHRFDYNTPVEETMQALHDVVQAGYARYIGMSSCWAWQFQAMQNYVIQNRLTPFISMQNHHNLLYREEREMLPCTKHFGVGCIAWSPLARGLLTRPLDVKTKRGAVDFYIGKYAEAQGTPTIMKRLEATANKRGVSMAQIAIAWTLHKEGMTAPIVGTTSLKNLQDIIGGAHITLSKEEIEYLEEPYQPQNVFGHI